MQNIKCLVLWSTCVSGLYNPWQHTLSEAPMPDATDANVYDPLNSQFESFVNKILNDFQTPGMAIAVIHGNQTWSAGYGYADLESGQRVTPHTMFQGGSTTKQFIAGLVSKMIYAEDSTHFGNIKWTTRMSDLIRDDFVLQDAYATEHLTLADALSHRTGMPRHDMSWTNGDLTPKDIVRNMRFLPLHNELRTTYEYCNMMFSTVSHALEAVTGRNTSALLKTWLWDPIGMNETVYSINDALAISARDDNDIQVASGYRYDEKSNSQVKVPWKSMAPANGAGGIVTTVLDLAKWVRQFLPGTNPDPVLASEAIEEMTNSHTPIPRDGRPWTGGSFYGFGLIRGVYRGYNLIGHDGAESGYMASIKWIPELDWGFVLLHNSYRMAYEPVSWRMVDDFLQTPEEERFDGARWVADMRHRFYDKTKNAKERLFPGSAEMPVIRPSVPLREYTGLYNHPAYHNFTLSIDPTEKFHPPKGKNGSLELFISPSAKSYEDQSGVLKHVSGEYWLAHMQTGPSSWVGNQALKVRFDIGPDGRVQRMGLQAEAALDQLAWFDKLT